MSNTEKYASARFLAIAKIPNMAKRVEIASRLNRNERESRHGIVNPYEILITENFFAGVSFCHKNKAQCPVFMTYGPANHLSHFRPDYAHFQ